MVSHKIFGYSLLASAHLLSCLSDSEIKKIKSVILFGSVARGNAEEESDVDLFFDTDSPKKIQLFLRSKLNQAAEDFYLTNKALEFRLGGIENEISLKVGSLEEWPDLAQSISSNGIILYKKYTNKPPGLKSYSIFSWKKPGKSKGALLNKFYGYKVGKKTYEGLIQKTKSIKIGSGTIMVPSEKRDLFIEVMEKYKIGYSRYDVWSQ